MVVDNATVGVDRDNRPNQEAAGQFQHRRTDAPFNGALHTTRFGHRRACPGPYTPFLNLTRVGGEASRPPLFRSRTDIRRDQAQVEQYGRGDDGHHRIAYGVTNTFLGQVPHHSGCSVQAEGAAATEHYPVDPLYLMRRSQQVGFPGTR